MAFAGKTVVVTGGASGIGAALVARLDAEGARTFVLDRQAKASEARCIKCDVSDPVDLAAALAEIKDRVGSVDMYVSNAGVLSLKHDTFGDPDDWARCWNVNVMAHVHAARLLVPDMLARGGGKFIIMASAAGLLNQVGDAPYSATKHAAVSFAESLAITHRDAGLGVTLVCPQYVATPLLGLSDDEAQGSLLTADEVAQSVLTAAGAGRFLVLPHPDVREYTRSRAEDHDRWIAGMARLRQRAVDIYGEARADVFYKLV